MRSTTYEKVLSLSYFSLLSSSISAFTPNNVLPTPIKTSSTSLGVSIGLGPGETTEEEDEKKELVAGVDYEIPDHEAYRTSRRSKLDEQCDEWFGALLGDEKDHGVLGSLADDARKILTTPVELVNEVRYKMPLMPP